MFEAMKQYEISFLTKTEADKEVILKALADIGASNMEEGRFSEIKLAYPIKKNTVAYFGSVVFESDPENVTKIGEALKFSEGVLRFLVITPPPKKPVSRYPFNQKADEIKNQEEGTGEDMLTENKEEKEEKPEQESSEKEFFSADKKVEVDDAALDEKLDEILPNNND
ncbi:MAG: 30S ribosomal protein S6 [Candidatus Colwellbacteria bacterium]|jgi:ribosomal protein S6|nr:30S ribosomal protein S6 [Candidatus Colwellbacteria bacterium]